MSKKHRKSMGRSKVDAPVAETTSAHLADGPRTSWWIHLAAAVVAVSAAGALFAQTRLIGFVGLDTYPIIVSSRIKSFGDLVGTFTETLMDGRYPWDFYRPLLNASIALDYAIWGLNAVGYQLTNALLHVLEQKGITSKAELENIILTRKRDRRIAPP